MTRSAKVAPAAGVVDVKHRRFPWPANPDQRYDSLASPSPFLAVVNARGPWAVWKHDTANPPYIPLCRGLLAKEFWQRASDGEKAFCLAVWMNAAREDDWGIVWGDPGRLCWEWHLDVATFTQRMDWMIKAGLACYLTYAERDAAIMWRPWQERVAGRKIERREGGKPRGGRGESGKGGEKQAEQAEQASKQDKPMPNQISDLPARTMQISDSVGETGQAEQAEQASQAKPQQAQATAQHSTEPANLPKSDHRAASGRSSAMGHARGPQRKEASRPGSVTHAGRAGDAMPMGEALGWNHPAAVSFGRRMYEAIKGRAPPADLMAAHDEDKGDVGVGVHYWIKHVQGVIAADRYVAFEDRCFVAIAKKRKVRSIRNLSKVAYQKIIPGELAAMTKDSMSGRQL